MPVSSSAGAERFQAPPHRFESRAPVQAKLELGAVDDPMEHEADSIADRAMSGSPGPVASGPPPINRTYADRDEEKEREPAPPEIGAGEAPAIVHQALRASGQPLDAMTRAYFEPRFACDFGHVRVHTDSKATDSARSIGALAYSVGSDLVFGAGHYQPRSAAGRQLIAHELAHVVQQSGAAPVVRRAVCYRPPTFKAIIEPIGKVLSVPLNSEAPPLANTYPTVDGRLIPSDNDAAVELIKNAFRPKSFDFEDAALPPKEPEQGSGSGSANTPTDSPKSSEVPSAGAGSGSGSANTPSDPPKTSKPDAGAGSGSSASPTGDCLFGAFDVPMSAEVYLPVAPSEGRWSTHVEKEELRGKDNDACSRKENQIPVAMTGEPDTAAVYERIKANEQEHVDDMIHASKLDLAPYYGAVRALKGQGGNKDECLANLEAQLDLLPDDKIRSFVARLNADRDKRDDPSVGRHRFVTATEVHDGCNRISITAKPKLNAPPPNPRAPPPTPRC